MPKKMKVEDVVYKMFCIIESLEDICPSVNEYIEDEIQRIIRELEDVEGYIIGNTDKLEGDENV